MKRNRRLYQILLVASFLGGNALILFGISSVLSYLNTGADRTSMLHLEVTMDEVYLPKIEWGSLENPGRPMEEQTLDEIQKDYLNAWYVRNVAYMKNDPYGIADYYTDSARIRLYEQIDLNTQNGNWYKSTTLSHHPELDFYSEDGTLVIFTDHKVEHYQETYRDETLLFKQRDTLSYRVMLLLEDGFWRIRHMMAVEPPKEPSKALATNMERRLHPVRAIQGTNYYPRDTPWDTFGKKFDENIVQHDFGLIQDMGLNTIRIFIPYEDFGKAQVKAKKVALLRSTLDMAHKNGLQVIVTLFDFYGDYDVTDWTLTQRHAETIVKAIKDHPALLGWDVKNEPDLDFGSRGRERVLAWLREMVQKIGQWDTVHPVTVGWSSPEAAVNLAKEVDFVSFHYYGEPHAFEAAYSALRQAVPDKHLLLQEYGFSSYDGIWNAYWGSEEDQAAYYAEMQPILEKEGIPFLFWGLYDFKEVPTSVVGRLPWRKQPQKHFGIFDIEGKPKAAYPHLVNKKEQ